MTQYLQDIINVENIKKCNKTVLYLKKCGLSINLEYLNRIFSSLNNPIEKTYF